MSRPNIPVTRSTTPTAADWPTFAPAWADSATIDGETVTFERRWALPGQFRDVDPLPVLRVEQTWTTAHGGQPAGPAHAARLLAGPGDLWADSRAALVAATLRDIADALDPQGDGEAAAA